MAVVKWILYLFFLITLPAVNRGAPPSKVNIWREGNEVFCRADKISPRPTLHWSTNPPSGLSYGITTKEIEQLFSINSSLTVPEGEPDFDYICLIRVVVTRRTATLVKSTTITTSKDTATIQSPTSISSLKSISWRFNGSETILTKTATSFNVTEMWKKHVKDLSPSGTLTLEELSKDQEGNYTCEVSTERETFVKSTMLAIESPRTDPAGVIAAGVAGGIFGLLLVTGLIFFTYKKNLFARFKKVNINSITTDST